MVSKQFWLTIIGVSFVVAAMVSLTICAVIMGKVAGRSDKKAREIFEEEKRKCS